MTREDLLKSAPYLTATTLTGALAGAMAGLLWGRSVKPWALGGAAVGLALPLLVNPPHVDDKTEA